MLGNSVHTNCLIDRSMLGCSVLHREVSFIEEESAAVSMLQVGMRGWCCLCSSRQEAAPESCDHTDIDKRKCVVYSVILYRCSIFQILGFFPGWIINCN